MRYLGFQNFFYWFYCFNQTTLRFVNWWCRSIDDYAGWVLILLQFIAWRLYWVYGQAIVKTTSVKPFPQKSNSILIKGTVILPVH